MDCLSSFTFNYNYLQFTFLNSFYYIIKYITKSLYTANNYDYYKHHN